MGKKLSTTALGLLLAIYESTEHQDGDWAKPLSRFWTPGVRWGSVRLTSDAARELHIEKINVGGAGDASALRGLLSRGLIVVASKHIPHAYAVTEDGLLAIEKLRE